MLLLSDNLVKKVIIKSAYADFIAINIFMFMLIFVIPICLFIILTNIHISAEYIFIKEYLPYIKTLLEDNRKSVATAHFIFYIYLTILLAFFLIKCRVPSILGIIFTLHSIRYTGGLILAFGMTIAMFLGGIFIYGHIYDNCLPNDFVCHINRSKTPDSLIYNIVFFVNQGLSFFVFLVLLKCVITKHISEIDYFTYLDYSKHYKEEFYDKIRYYLGQK